MPAIHFAKDLRKRLPAFEAFLSARGAEVLSPTNEWEVVRFKAGAATAVIYTNARGGLRASGVADEALSAFVSNGKWRAAAATKARGNSAGRIETLLRRDGPNCFLCRQPLGDDLTVEHLVPRTSGGPDRIANLALAHSACNLRMGHLSLMEKIALREKGSTA
jgi:hypothetical protein